MTAMLMVMSGIDPHTIRVTWVGMIGKLGVSHSCILGQVAVVDFVIGLMSRLRRRAFGLE
jgi:hypothetical protein